MPRKPPFRHDCHGRRQRCPRQRPAPEMQLSYACYVRMVPFAATLPSQIVWLLGLDLCKSSIANLLDDVVLLFFFLVDS